MKRLNVEIKARCSNLAGVRARLMELTPRVVGEDHQIDTYFRVENGRLKLRRGKIETALIAYRRPDESGPRRSDVLLYSPADADQLLETLASALGILVVVDKRREIAFVDNVKIHLDRVQGLGQFVEIEAIDRDGSIGEERLREQCVEMMVQLGVEAADLVDESYSDLLISARNAIDQG